MVVLYRIASWATPSSFDASHQFWAVHRALWRHDACHFNIASISHNTVGCTVA
jgi:hypothetical protein